MNKIMFACSLLLYPMLAWAQGIQNGIVDIVTVPSFGSGDSGFEKMVDWELAASAASASDPVGLTDVALQLAEAERVMLRSHGSIPASTLFQLAIRAAVKRGDGETLERLAKGAKLYGLDEIANDAETSKRLTDNSREGIGDRGRDGKVIELLEQLSDDEKFQFGLFHNQVTLATGNTDDLKTLKAVLVEDTTLDRAAKGFLIAEIDDQIKDLESLSEGEREVLLALSAPSRQVYGQQQQNRPVAEALAAILLAIAERELNKNNQGGGSSSSQPAPTPPKPPTLPPPSGKLIASSGGKIDSRSGNAKASGWYDIYDDGRVKIKHWTMIDARHGSAHSTYLLTVVENTNNKNKIIWATKHGFSVGSSPWRNESKDTGYEWRSMPQAVADKIRSHRAVVCFTLTTDQSSGFAAQEKALKQLGNQATQAAVQAAEAWLMGL
ncbi:MAG: hypothetical protein LBI05_06395 [Planctomycetaceae bacterium]|jgi:hypothetical protein|nr:hypothetical protein [Planctomycetaceae bacterium]